MDYFAKVKADFTLYIKAVIQNASTDYKRKLLKSLEREISVADFSGVPKELLSCDDNSFFMENDITYSNIENLFTDKNHYTAMQKLTDKEKLVLYLTVIEEKTAEEVAETMNTTKENIRMIKSRAIKNFLHNYTSEK